MRAGRKDFFVVFHSLLSRFSHVGCQSSIPFRLIEDCVPNSVATKRSKKNNKDTGLSESLNKRRVKMDAFLPRIDGRLADVM